MMLQFSLQSVIANHENPEPLKAAAALPEALAVGSCMKSKPTRCAAALLNNISCQELRDSAHGMRWLAVNILMASLPSEITPNQHQTTGSFQMQVAWQLQMWHRRSYGASRAASGAP